MDRDFVHLHKKDRYHHRSHNKTKLFVHLVFATKYRKQLLFGQIDTDIKQIVFDTAKSHHWYILKMETDQDHIHILLQYPPTDSNRHIVSILKQISTYQIWQMHPHILSRYY